MAAGFMATSGLCNGKDDDAGEERLDTARQVALGWVEWVTLLEKEDFG